MPTPAELQSMDMDVLSSHYNSLVGRALAMGGDSTVYRPVVKFSNRASGVRRCVDLERDIKEKTVRRSRAPNDPATHPPGTDQTSGPGTTAATPAAAAGPKSPKEKDPNAPPTIHELTGQFNALVPEAQRLGIAWAKEHSSDFASRDGANKQLDRLKADIAKAKEPPPPVTDGAGQVVGEQVEA